ncbi:hypothetical protein F0562_011151 [Nyssa sinensis]|uniref:RNase III domain-containing protein n=1 Tax=Nyssa sinensis TaxID=561372 RepID=A0A5J5A413_9ASTE|nr:hypothetical protein F0562_011151 [Nyssa sinensis]
MTKGYCNKPSRIIRTCQNFVSYERLEFVGDSVLNFLIAKEHYFLYPDLPPGKLTPLRAANVDTEKLARVAIKLNLHKYLRHKKPLLDGQIREFMDAILEYPLHSYGLIDAPKALADVVESTIGAIFVDSKSMDTTWKVVKGLLEPRITPEMLQAHPAKKLYETCQKNGFKIRLVDLWSKEGAYEIFVNNQLKGREKLARVAIKLNLHKYLRHKKRLFDGQIREFMDAILEYPLHSYGLIDAPKVLADVVESTIGAIFIDSKSMDTTWKVVKRLLEPIITPETMQTHPMTKLYEICQKNGYELHMVDVWKETGEIEFLVNNEFFGKGIFSSKRFIALNRAANNAYNEIVRKFGVEDA